MNDFEWLKKLERVAAPPDFEDRVLERLRRRRRERENERRFRGFRWALAGAAAGLLVGFAVLNLFVLRGPSGDRRAAAGNEWLPITESVDYRNEARSAAPEAGTVFILEQVSDASHTLIKY
jgi:hypothetical protein